MSRYMVSQVNSHRLSRPDATAFVFVRRHDDPGEVLTWAQLWQSAEYLASALPDRESSGPAGVLICCRDNRNFVVSLVAAWIRGLTVIPGAGGLTSRIGERNRHILELARPDVLLHDLPSERATDLTSLASGAHCLNVVDFRNIPDGPPADRPVARSYDGEGGLLQFTSGSVSSPKAVLLEPEQIELNCNAILRTYDLCADRVGVNWLPLFHDMGLVGSVLINLMAGGLSVILDTSAFIQRPACWLENISRWKANITAAPNFAFERLVSACTDAELANVDLSSLQSVIMGGEPVREATVRRMIARLGPSGLSAASIAPSYGMAEVALLVSSGQKPEGPVFQTRHTRSAVACLGEVVPELNLVIRDPATGLPVPEGHVGEVFLSGACAGQVLSSEDDWRAPPRRSDIRTGDFGYLENGEIFVTGRSALKLIVRGRNIFAEDIEKLVMDSQKSDRIHGIAAIGLNVEGSQQLCLLIELARRSEPVPHSELNHAILSGAGVKPARIVQLRFGTLPRTSSGKIRHAVARDQFLTGQLNARVITDVQQTGN